MPIRINLLAEMQAAEEARRRDPVKRTVLAGVGLVVVMLLWMTMLTLQVRQTKNELAGERSRLAGLADRALVVSNNNRVLVDLTSKADALVKYATNRFLWGTALDAFQHTTLSNVWVMELASVQSYSTNAEFKAETNITIALKEPRKWYQLWGKDTKTNVQAVITNMFASLTNRVQFATGRVAALLRNELRTNRERTTVAGKLIAIRPLATRELLTLAIKARDFGTPLGSMIEPYTNALLTNPFFGAYLSRTNISVDRNVRASSDLLDRFNTNPHVAFEVKAFFPPRVRANER